MIVVDSSALIDALLDDALFERLVHLSKENELVAPSHLDVECLHALRKLERLGIVSNEEAETGVFTLENLQCKRVPIKSMLQKMWKIRVNFSAYDAAYVVLCLDTGASLLTHDKRLANAASNLIKVISIANGPAP